MNNNQLISLPENESFKQTGSTWFHMGQGARALLPEVYRLVLSNNHLASLPEWLGQLKNLMYLDLSNNKLTSLPESITQLNILRELSLKGNELPEFSGHVKKWIASLQKKGCNVRHDGDGVEAIFHFP